MTDPNESSGFELLEARDAELTGARPASNRAPSPRVPAPEPEQLDDEPLSDHQAEYRCEWCYGYLPADGLCRCPGSLHDLEQQRLEQRYEMEKER